MTESKITEGAWVITITEDIDPDDGTRAWFYRAVCKLTGETRTPSLTPYASDPEELARMWVAAGLPGRRKVGGCSFNWCKDDLVQLVEDRTREATRHAGFID